jgi:hypothetical protein
MSTVLGFSVLVAVGWGVASSRVGMLVGVSLTLQPASIAARHTIRIRLVLFILTPPSSEWLVVTFVVGILSSVHAYQSNVATRWQVKVRLRAIWGLQKAPGNQRGYQSVGAG